MPEYVIRRARPTLADATALLSVERRTLGDSRYSAREALRVIRRPEHHAYLAVSAGKVIGFCSCFETEAAPGKCLEIDMIGTLPEHQSRGVGTRLLEYSLDEARQRCVTQARAVVALGNLGSQKAFGNAGLRPSSSPYDMLVYSVLGRVPVPFLRPGWSWHRSAEGRFAPPDDYAGAKCSASGRHRNVHWIRTVASTVAMAEVVQVETLAYRGLWIENLLATSQGFLCTLARALVEEAKRLDLDEVGFLFERPTARSGNDEEYLTLAREGYQPVGTYRIYEARLA